MRNENGHAYTPCKSIPYPPSSLDAVDESNTTEFKTKKVGRLTVKTKCTCKKPDWVTQISNDDLMEKDIYYLQCDACKEYAFAPKTNKNILIAIPNEEIIDEQLNTFGTLKTMTIEGGVFIVLNK